MDVSRLLSKLHQVVNKTDVLFVEIFVSEDYLHEKKIGKIVKVSNMCSKVNSRRRQGSRSNVNHILTVINIVGKA